MGNDNIAALKADIEVKGRSHLNPLLPILDPILQQVEIKPTSLAVDARKRRDLGAIFYCGNCHSLIERGRLGSLPLANVLAGFPSPP